MKVLVHYVDFHCDNYQGASGKSFQFQKIVEVPADLPASEVKGFVLSTIEKEAKESRPFTDCHGEMFSIQKMELFF